MTSIHSQRVGFSEQRLARVDRLLENYVESGRLAGALGLVYRKGEIAYCNAYGYRDRGGRPGYDRGYDLPHLLNDKADHRCGRSDVV